MKKITELLLGALMAIVGFQSASALTFVGGRTDFRDETIYFAITTRFYDGDVSNNTYCWDGVNNVNDPEWRGDFKGLIEKLDYIKALGFTAVWITPIVENCSGLDYHGYHAFNFSKVDPRYESDDCKFEDLVKAAHDRDMKIVLDIVLQHTGNFGEDHLCPLFEKDYTVNQSNINNVLKFHTNTRLPSNYFSLNANSQYQARLAQMKNTDGQNHDNHNYWHHYGSGWNWDEPNRWWGQIAGDCVDLNTENPAVINYLAQCYGSFIAMGVDAFRIDTSGHIARLAFNKGFIPKFQALGEQYKSKRLNQAPFFMFGEVCARYSEATYRGNDCLSPYYYTWKPTQEYAWDDSETSWDNYTIMEGYLGEHPNIQAAVKEGEDYMGTGHYTTSSSNNAFLNGNDYHTPDYSMASGMSVIDFTMHWNFGSASQAFNVKQWDGMYNDATWNVVYVDSHDYGPDSFARYGGGTDAWAENMSLMFTFRGIPCLYYGSEIEFRKGVRIDEGANLALKNSGRAYYGGYLTGTVNTTDFGKYESATGNVAATLSSPLAIHLARLNQIRAAVPALRKGQYSTQGCSGSIAFKRRYTDSNTDSYCLVTISGGATFSSIPNGTYTDVVTGDVKTVTDGKLTASCSGKGNMRCYVLSTSKTPAPGKIGNDTQYLYNTSAAPTTQKGYDGQEEADDTVTVRDTTTGGGGGGGGSIEEPETPIAPSMSEGEQAVFFENSANWSGYIYAYAWNGSTKYAGAWPGSVCTYLGNGIWKWQYTGNEVIPATAGIIFNVGSDANKTIDMTWVNGGYYNANGYVKTIEGAGEITPPTPDPGDGTYNIYFDNSASNWSSVFTWVWDNSNNYTGGTWPGKQLSVDATSGYYKYTFTTTNISGQLMCIFNSGSDANKTLDLELKNNGIYNANGFTGNYVSTGVDISTLAPALKVYTMGGTLYIESPVAVDVPIYRADGTYTIHHVHEGVTSIMGLTRGFYIVNNVKVIL